jgi:acetate kinase
LVRHRVCTGLEAVGIALDPERNRSAVGVEALISPPDSRVAVLAVPTNEALQIALETHRTVLEDQAQ